jgi:cytidylate kinase
MAEGLGWERYSGGDFMRQYAIDNGYFDPKKTTHHLATAYPDDFDRKVDMGLREKLGKMEHHIYESWLSGFLAQGVPGTLKILVYCSDDAVRVDRIANRDDISIAEAKVHIFTREEKNLEKWKKMYAPEWKEWVVGAKTVPASEPIYFWRPELYDLAIDTFRMGKEQTLERALAKVFEN